MSLLVFLILLLVGVGAIKKVTHPPFGLSVYVMLDSQTIRQISAVTSSFQFTGVFYYAWQDDSLVDYAGSGADYLPLAPLSSLAYELETLDPETSMNTTKTVGPVLTTAFKSALSSALDEMEWVVSDGVPDWVGAVVAPADSTWILGSQTISKVFSATQDLVDFPFDTQILTIPVEVKGLDAIDFSFDNIVSILKLSHRLAFFDGYLKSHYYCICLQ